MFMDLWKRVLDVEMLETRGVCKHAQKALLRKQAATLHIMLKAPPYSNPPLPAPHSVFRMTNLFTGKQISKDCSLKTAIASRNEEEVVCLLGLSSTQLTNS